MQVLVEKDGRNNIVEDTISLCRVQIEVRNRLAHGGRWQETPHEQVEWPSTAAAVIRDALSTYSTSASRRHIVTLYFRRPASYLL